ncbi:MAG TPA: M28 family peptidase [Gemmatimonadales bacterium]|nr:M28 family peptidase [Gemmatimonadales bacterium]
MRTLLPLLLLAAACGGASAPQVPAPDPHGAWPYELPRFLAPRPTTPAITAADLATRLYIIADDSMQGREAGTPGNVMVTNYIASEFARLGLRPMGDHGTYFQTIGFVSGGFEGTPALSFRGQGLVAWQEFAPLAPISNAPLQPDFDRTDVPTLYAGRWGDTAVAIDPARAQGAILVLQVPLDPRGAPVIGFWNVPDPRVAALSGSIAGVLLVAPRTVVAAFTNVFQARRTGLLPAPKAGTFPALVAADSSLTGALFPQPIDSVAPGTMGAPLTAAFHYAYRPVPDPARNVIAMLPGSDPALRAQYVVIGAHNDHVGIGAQALDHDSLRAANIVTRPIGANQRPRTPSPDEAAEIAQLLENARAKRGGAIRRDSIFNGAIDDGSGTVILLEIAEALVHEPAPRRSILFVSHTGEEKGLLGSQWFTDHPTVPRDSIVAALNMDMPAANRDPNWTPGTPYGIQLIGSRRLSTQLGATIDSINASYGRDSMAIDYSYDAPGHPLNRYCRSDHFMYARYGIPITYFSFGYSPDYHMVSDEPQYIDYPRSEKAAHFVHDILVASADRPQRYVVDGKRQDPNQPCRQ